MLADYVIMVSVTYLPVPLGQLLICTLLFGDQQIGGRLASSFEQTCEVQRSLHLMKLFGEMVCKPPELYAPYSQTR